MASLVSKVFAVVSWPWRTLNGGTRDARIAGALRERRQEPNAMNLWGEDMSEAERDRLDGRRP